MSLFQSFLLIKIKSYYSWNYKDKIRIFHMQMNV